MNTYQPIDCDLHDHLEIACLYSWVLKIELDDGKVITAKSITTLTRPGDGEFLILDDDGERVSIRLDYIHAITHLDKNKPARRIVFK
jgi:Rho-binding antiterminator